MILKKSTNKITPATFMTLHHRRERRTGPFALSFLLGFFADMIQISQRERFISRSALTVVPKTRFRISKSNKAGCAVRCCCYSSLSWP